MKTLSLYRARAWTRPKNPRNINIVRGDIDVIARGPREAIRKAERVCPKGTIILDVQWQCTIEVR